MDPIINFLRESNFQRFTTNKESSLKYIIAFIQQVLVAFNSLKHASVLDKPTLIFHKHNIIANILMYTLLFLKRISFKMRLCINQNIDNIVKDINNINLN